MSYVQFFSTSDGIRIAYAIEGRGMPLIYLPPFLSHLELMWETPAYRAFNETLASRFTLIRYDRYGCGLSDRDRTDFSLGVDLHILSELIEHLRLRRVVLFGLSAGGRTAIQYAVTNPRKVGHLLLFGISWQAGTIPPTRAAVNQLMRVDWRIGSNALADYLLPSGSAEDLAWLARVHREAASPEVAVGLAEAAAAIDLGELLPRITTPTLVMNRRGDRLALLENARELAAQIPGARFAALPGDAHIAEFGDLDAVMQTIVDFIGPGVPANGLSDQASEQPAGPLGLSARETEVIELIGAGLTNREIAERLSLSVHTVERHTVNIYTKLGVRGRTAAAAYVRQRMDVTENGTT